MPGRRLPPSLREEFGRPVGVDVTAEEIKQHATQTIAVGDVVSLTVWENGTVPLLSVYDGYTERREHTDFARFVQRTGREETVVENPAGTVTSGLEEAVRNALQGKTPRVIRVIGEEDLALLPCVLYAPEGAWVVYGWPGKGMKAVVTDADSRRWAGEMLGRMEELT